MTPETVAAITAVTVAVVSAGPSYMALRRARGAAQDEGTATRSALEDAVSRLEGRMDAVRTELRDDIRDVREWQTSHTAEHILMTPRPRDDT